MTQMPRLQILHEIPGSKTIQQGLRAKHNDNLLLCASFCYPSRDDICNDIAWLDPRKEELRHLTQA